MVAFQTLLGLAGQHTLTTYRMLCAGESTGWAEVPLCTHSPPTWARSTRLQGRLRAQWPAFARKRGPCSSYVALAKRGLLPTSLAIAFGSPRYAFCRVR